jgi:cell division protein FtsW
MRTDALPLRVATLLKGDKVIWAIILLLAVFSIFAVYSSIGMLAYQQRGGQTEYYLLKHGLFLSAGLVVTWVVSHIPYVYYGRLARVMLFITLPLLLYTLFFGVEINDARRWIAIPFVTLTFQASDLAKVTLVLFVARQLASMQDLRLDLRTLGLPVLLPVVITCGLIAPANLSTAALLFATIFILMIVGRLDLRTVGILMGAGLLLFAFVFLIGMVMPEATRTNTWIARVTEFTSNPDGGYQNQQAKIAIAKGGLFGEGPGNSYQRNVLPSGFSDFIYAIFIEEYGFVGGFLLLMLYLIFLWRCIRLVTLCDKAFGSLLVMGMGLLIVLQALANMAVAVNLTPVTGVTLPFMSMGGTSLLFFSLAAGMILSVSRYVERQQKKAAAETQVPS